MVVTKFTCPACAAHLTSVKPPLAGSRFHCPQCGAHFPVPMAVSMGATPTRAASRSQERPSGVPDLPNDIYGAGGPNGQAEPQESPVDLVETKGHTIRSRALVAGGGLVFLLAVGITLAVTLSTSTSTSNPAPEVAKAPLGYRPEQGTQRESAAPLPAPAQEARRPQPEPDQKAAKADEPPRDVAGVLADGKPPLTQVFLDRWFAYLEWLFEIRLTEPQRRDCRELWVQHWKETDQLKKDRFWLYANAELQWWNKVAKQSEAERAELRAEKRLPFLARLGKSTDRLERLLLELYQSAHEPGAERNPILVATIPPLTQDMVDEGRRLLQWVLDVRLTAPQRQVFQESVMKSWLNMDESWKDGFLQRLQVWNVITQLGDAEQTRLREKLRPELLAQLRSAPADEASQCLLEMYDKQHNERLVGGRNLADGPDQVLVPGNPPPVPGLPPAEDKKPADETAKDEITKLEGIWQVSSIVVAGKKVPFKDLELDEIVFKADKVTAKKLGKELMTLGITVDPSKKPKAMDWIHLQQKGSLPLPGIYAVNDERKNEEIRLCFPMLPSKDAKPEELPKDLRQWPERPKSFNTQGESVMLIIAKREKR